MSRWYIMIDEKVSGPLSESEIDSLLKSNPDAMIWGRGLPEWVEFSKWKQLQNNSSPPSNTPIIETERRWKYRYQGKESPLMPMNGLIQQLKRYRDYAHLEIWADGFEDWIDIFKVPQVIEKLGISRRAHARVPIMGVVDCESGDYKFRARVISISQGGLGLTEGHGLKLGQRFKVSVSSPNLFTSIHAEAEIVYVGTDGYAGMRFETITAESQGAIIEYVKKFQEAKELSQAK